MRLQEETMYRAVRRTPMPTIKTIGHSNQTLGEFLGALAKHQVRELVDVRSRPFSRFVPHFNRENLAGALLQAGIAYTFAGDTLGGRPQNLGCYDEAGRVQYHIAAQDPGFQQAIQDLAQRAENWEIAVMCTERDPAKCHRTLMVAHELEKQGAQVAHILQNGTQQEHHETISTLMARWRPTAPPEVLQCRKLLVEHILRKQCQEVG